MQYLIGIDDTDNLESRGTGFCARTLGASLASAGLAKLRGITRHQLLVSPEIRYTSHNSSACLAVEAEDRYDLLADFAAACLVSNSAIGSDVGLCISQRGRVTPLVQAFGERAKREVLFAEEASALARSSGLMLEGLTGDGGGVIGALAAVGLHARGEDGRFLWLPGIRDLAGWFPASEVRQLTGIQEFRTLQGEEIPVSDIVELGAWCRPILRGGRALLLVEPADGLPNHWRVAGKEIIKEQSA